ncbi:hypothetical protein [Pseudactinotalea terrae]|uniref:hypothetical protein n=1 Tax=Pseudactinotalea terrae TaxID=1743262 RepID=UPI0019D659FB|nr:hypothetical protein [Pseudactinotalea terrae]
MARVDLGDPALREALHAQDGVIAWRQLSELGAQQHDVDRMVRRRELRRVHRGVYIDHTGPLTRRQREWVAVVALWPAALADESALPGPPPGRIDIAIGPGRTVQAPAGVRVRRIEQLDRRVRWQRSPPRVGIEHATLDVMSKRVRGDDVAGAFATLVQSVSSRETTVDRILAALEERRRIGGRRLLTDMLTDVRDGICSVLERGYRDRVERPHGLPRPDRQHVSEATGFLTHQDVRYLRYDLIVELDGLAFHSSAAARDQDAARDLAEMADSGAPTARVTYGLVFSTPCRTAHWIAKILRRRGWRGQPRRCPDCPSPDRPSAR